MIQLIKLHIGLAKYLIQELPKRKTLKEKLELLKPIPKAYLGELVRLYKNVFLIFDKEYQKKKKEYKKYQQIKIDLKRCLKMLQYLDDKMEKTGVNRQRRRQFWRDFYKDGAIRKDVFEDLLKEINLIR